MHTSVKLDSATNARDLRFNTDRVRCVWTDLLQDTTFIMVKFAMIIITVISHAFMIRHYYTK